MAAQAGIEEAGEQSFTNRQSNMLGDGFSFSGYERDGFYMNMGNRSYRNISGISGLDSISDGRGAVFADFDNDGDTDVFMTTIQGEAHLLFRNNIGKTGNFIRVALVGNKSGKDAFGAVIRLKTDAGILTKIKSGGAGYLSQHDSRLLFGMANQQQAQWLEVTWPSGLKQRFEQIPAGKSLLIREGADQWEPVTEQSFTLPDPLDAGARLLQTLNVNKGDAFPDLNVTDLQGNKTHTAAIRPNGRKTLVNLWATWCVPCAREMPELQALYETGDLAVIGISLDAPGSEQKAAAFLKRHKIKYPNFLRDDQLVEQIFSGDEVSIPLSFLLDEQGRVMDLFSGWSPEIGEKLRNAIN